jgi:hypothetical protein
MDMSVNLPLLVTLVVTLELEQVFQAVVKHPAVQYCLHLVLLLAVDESCGWEKHRSSANNGIREHGGRFDCGEDGVKAAEVVREFEAVCALADASFDDKGS